jgi:hypothetical protein
LNQFKKKIQQSEISLAVNKKRGGKWEKLIDCNSSIHRRSRWLITLIPSFNSVLLLSTTFLSLSSRQDTGKAAEEEDGEDAEQKQCQWGHLD